MKLEIPELYKKPEDNWDSDSIFMECWSNGVLEKQNPTPIFCDLKQGSLGFSDA
jgi:hypothetical protein